MFIKEISYTFLYIWHCIEMYDKKFFINGNCMIRISSQPGCFGSFYSLAYWFRLFALPFSSDIITLDYLDRTVLQLTFQFVQKY